MTDQKRPIEQAVDIALYAPLGFLLEARKLLPTFVERGRNQVTMTKIVGKFAVDQGRKEAGKVLTSARERSMPAAPATPGAAAADSSGSAAAGMAAAAQAPTAQSGAGAADLAIPSYDSLAASQVIPRLESLSPDELSAVARYELDHRARKTILGKISQLQAG